MISEDILIARYLAPISGAGSMSLLDDAAVLSPPRGHDLVLTKDALVAGVHFFADDPPQSIARKALRVNLSDLAAKGATPAGFLLALALPSDIDESWIKAFAGGLVDDARAYACPLLGGDTVKASGGLTISVTAIGYCETGRMVKRTSGRSGHKLMVTGTIGDAALGLQVRLQPDAAWVRALSPDARAQLADRYLHPQPRNVLATIIRDHAAAAMDVSDGLLGDAMKLAASARVHGVSVAPRIDLALVPLSLAAQQAIAHDPALISTIVTGGDDYEVLMAASEDQVERVASACGTLRVTATVIGELVDGQAAVFVGRDGQPVHFGTHKFEHAWSE